MRRGKPAGTVVRELRRPHCRRNSRRRASRIDEIELNLFVAGAGRTVSDIDLSVISAASGMSADQLADLPGVLVGSPREIADTLLR